MPIIGEGYPSTPSTGQEHDAAVDAAFNRGKSLGLLEGLSTSAAVILRHMELLRADMIHVITGKTVRDADPSNVHLNMPLDDIGLSMRTYSALMHEGVKTVGDIPCKEDLLNIPRFGQFAANEVEAALVRLGVFLPHYRG